MSTLGIGLAFYRFSLTLIKIQNAWTRFDFLLPFTHSVCHLSWIGKKNWIDQTCNFRMCSINLITSFFVDNRDNRVIFVCLCINPTWLADRQFGDFLRFLFLSSLFFWFSFRNHLDVHINCVTRSNVCVWAVFTSTKSLQSFQANIEASIILWSSKAFYTFVFVYQFPLKTIRSLLIPLRVRSVWLYHSWLEKS